MQVRWLEMGAASAARNMAIDEVLLASAEVRPSVRVYAWDPPAVSLGRFQAPDFEGIPAGHDLVRRATGGGAIVHRDEVTFAVAAPLRALGGEGRGVRAAFHAVNRAIAAGLAGLGVAVDAGIAPDVESAANHGNQTGCVHTTAPIAAFLCYERKSDTDLTVRGEKLVGSAQRRQGKAVLQHGSVPLGADPAVPGRSATLSRVLGRTPSFAEVARALRRGFESALGWTLAPAALSPEEDARAHELATALEVVR